MRRQNTLLDDLKDEIAQGEVVVVIGTGVSVGATENSPVASWIGLLHNGIERCSDVVRPLSSEWFPTMQQLLQLGDIDALLAVAHNIAAKLGAPSSGEYKRWLAETVGRLELKDPSVLRALCALNVPLATTNYDSLIEQVTGWPPVTWLNSGKVEQVIRGDKSGVLHLHGFWDEPESVVLSPSSYQRAITDMHLQTTLRALRIFKSMLFVGFGDGLHDPNFGDFLRWTRTIFAGSEYRCYRLALDHDVDIIQSQHPSDERLYVLGFGSNYSALAPFIEDLCPMSSPKMSGIEAKKPLLLTTPIVNGSQPKHNLPHRHPFIGRKDDIDDVIRLLKPDIRAYIIAIDGVGGIGKSATALEVAYFFLLNHVTIPEVQRFDAIIYASAKMGVLTESGILNRKPDVNCLADLYRTISSALNAPQIIQTAPGRQEGVVRRLLSEQRVLLILDNLETMEDATIINFINDLPHPTRCIVTSRNRVGLIAATVRLRGLTLEDTKKLVIETANSSSVVLSKEQVSRLCSETGGVPLAVVWSIGLMSVGHDPESVLRRLKSGSSDLSKFCFEESVAYIRSTAAYPLLLSMSLFETYTDRRTLSATAGLDYASEICIDALADLVRLSLLNEEAKGFTALPLTRQYALSELYKDSAVEVAIRARWVDTLIALARPYSAVGWIWKDMAPLNLEGEHLHTLSIWAFDNRRSDIISAIAPALDFYYDIIGDWNERLKINKSGFEAARLVGNQEIEFVCLRNCCGVLGQQGKFVLAESAIHEALSLARQAQVLSWQCKALISLAMLMRRQKLFDKATTYCKDAYDATSKMSTDEQLQARASIDYERGKLARDLEEWDIAEKHFISARGVFARVDANTQMNLDQAWGVLSNLAFVEHKKGALDSSAQLYLQCLEYCRRAGSKGSIATLLFGLAGVEEDRKNLAEAKQYAIEAAQWTEQLGLVHESKQIAQMLSRLQK